MDKESSEEDNLDNLDDYLHPKSDPYFVDEEEEE